MVRIAVDAMGGDHAPLAIVRGAEAACAEKIAEVVLVGDERVIAPLLKDRSRIEIVHTRGLCRHGRIPIHSPCAGKRIRP